MFKGKTYNIYKYPNNVHVYLQIKRAQKSYTKYKQEIKIYVKSMKKLIEFFFIFLTYITHVNL